MAPSAFNVKTVVQRGTKKQRRVRARLETHDDQIEGLGITARQHDLRLQYLESPFKWVTRGFTCTQSFLSTKDENFKAAKATFLTDFLAELRNSTPGMVEAHVAELEGLLLEEEGAVLIGVFPTGGWLDDLPDCSVRFQQGFVWAPCWLSVAFDFSIASCTSCSTPRASSGSPRKGQG